MWPLAEEILETLALRFPVCMTSDEFHYFPQYQSHRFIWAHWDDFSPGTIAALVGDMTQWEKALMLQAAGPPLADRTIEAKMILRIINTLREQLTLVRFHETQPTFYLTIVGIGLADAIASGPRALTARMKSLPAFLQQASDNLSRVPRLFRDMGLDMLRQQRQWIHTLELDPVDQKAVDTAFAHLETALSRAVVQAAQSLPVSVYERIATAHMGCQWPPQAIADALDQEIAETRGILTHSAETLAPERPWQSVVETLPTPGRKSGGVIAVYDATIETLARHCVRYGIVDPDFLRICPVTVSPIPGYMRPVRSNAAYSMPPGHPPRGGTFFILESSENETVPVDHRLLAAHETYPGHHVLDAWRWRHPRPVRRHLEFPIFYEGWASFAEELMFDLGFFDGPADRMLMAKRRFWRAMRGKADLEMHMGRCTLEDAAGLLTSEGMPPQRAKAMVRRYRLKPGYQLAYTIGRRRFRMLFDAWRRKGRDPAAFARKVLSQGEIGLDDLEQVLQ